MTGIVESFFPKLKRPVPKIIALRLDARKGLGIAVKFTELLQSCSVKLSVDYIKHGLATVD